MVAGPEPRSTREYLIEITAGIRAIDAKIDNALVTVADHGRRLAELEAWKNRSIGAAAASGCVAGGLISLVAYLVAHH